MNPLFLIDFYKTGHIRQYPDKTQYVYSNFTPRSSKFSPTSDGKVVVMGVSKFVQDYLIDSWNENFFFKDKETVVGSFVSLVNEALGDGAVDPKYLEDLHDLGRLPLLVKAIPEGTVVNLNTPILTVINTDPRFYWLTNYIETALSCSLWKSCTAATIARDYRAKIEKYSNLTGGEEWFKDLQCHDFSFRGLSGFEDAQYVGLGHLLYFSGTDTVPAIVAAKEYYGAEGVVGMSVPATEHSVMCMGQKDNEKETFRRLIEDVYSSGIVSIVSDTWDLWKVMTEILPSFKDKILARDGKVVIRPDSGDPEKIICGDPLASPNTPERKGCLRLLEEVFGSSKNSKGYKKLNDKVGLIYGDSITLERCERILSSIERMGFCTDSIVFGVGSFTYQHVTRDTYGFAMKATWGVVDGNPINISKDPITGSGKKSRSGLLRVNEDFTVSENVSIYDERTGMLKEVFPKTNIPDFFSIRRLALQEFKGISEIGNED